ncbi:MAG: hypothetical protein HY717_20050 [Planctomycetes bacterium]|nr:hypothetical protein [Planctomycetota bacterium]
MKLVSFFSFTVFGLLVFTNTPAFGQPFVRGDADAIPTAGPGSGGTVELGDAIFTLEYLFLGGPAPPCLDAADTNADGDLNISDPIMTLQWVFGVGPALPPPPPTPSVGGVPYPPGDCLIVPGPLGCGVFPPC